MSENVFSDSSHLHDRLDKDQILVTFPPLLNSTIFLPSTLLPGCLLWVWRLYFRDVSYFLPEVYGSVAGASLCLVFVWTYFIIYFSSAPELLRLPKSEFLSSILEDEDHLQFTSTVGRSYARVRVFSLCPSAFHSREFPQPAHPVCLGCAFSRV